MSEVEELIINGGLAMLLLEMVKWLIRFVVKKPEFDFTSAFYFVAIPVLNVLVVPLLALLQVGSVTMPTDWISWGRSAVLVLVSSLISLLFYNGGYKRLKEYREQELLLKNAKG